MLVVPWSNPERAVTAGFVCRWAAALLLAAIDGEPGARPDHRAMRAHMSSIFQATHGAD